MSTSVLVVEDDDMFANAVQRDLREQGFMVSVAASVGEALPILSLGSVDVMLTDLQLGAQDGIDLLEAVRELSPRTRAVLMSGFASARDYERAIELGAVRVLCKPFTPSDLIQCIRQAAECETGFRGSVHGLSLVDVLQMFNYGRRSTTITVSGRSPGRLHLADGQIIHVEHQGQIGEAALRSLLSMPAGTLSTTALHAATPRSITREFRELLLDALRSLDESAGAEPTEEELDLALDAAIEPPRSPHGDVLARVRNIEGYLASCVVLSASGGVLDHDGSIDLRPAAPLTAEVIRHERKLIVALGIDDDSVDVLVTATTQYHLLRSLQSEVPAFIHLVLDRRVANPAMAKLALANLVATLDL